MWIPKHYITPIHHPVFLEANAYDIDTKWWGGPSPYEGPAFHNRNNAKLLLAPDTPDVHRAAGLLAAALSCPDQRYKRICSPDTINSFGCLFGVTAAPQQCSDDPAACLSDPACRAAALSDHIAVMESEAAALAAAERSPATVDAVVAFGAGIGAPGGGAPGDGGTLGPVGAPPGQGHEAAVGAYGLLSYVIRMNHTDVPPPGLLRDLFDVSPGEMPVPGNLLWEYRRYWFFLNLQLAIDRALIAMALDTNTNASAAAAGGAGSAAARPAGAPAPAAASDGGGGNGKGNGTVPASISVRIKPFPWPPRSEDLGAASAAAALNLLLVYAFLAPTRALVVDVVREKELRLREGMRILGLTDLAYWSSWAITHWTTLAASGALCTLAGLYPFSHSAPPLMLAFYWLFGAALVAFGYCLSALFGSSRVAGTASQLLYAVSMIPGFLLPFTRPLGGPSWFWACLSPTSAASLFAAALVNWERAAEGISWRTLWLPITQDSVFSAGHVLLLLALDVPLYLGAAWYLDKVLPKAFGQRLPPWFPLSPSYWRQRRGRPGADADAGAAALVPAAAGAAGGTAGAMDGARTRHGGGPSGVPPAISVRDLVKVFPSGGGGGGGTPVVALDGLSLDARRGAVTALLGHNGAGKTTAIHILTGMLQPTSGAALVEGLDVSTSMASIRRSLGVCPQFDILWPQLTVREHLEIYWALKGGAAAEGPAARGAAAAAAAAEVGLGEKLDAQAGQLSGGQRRKLSVAIAFLGEPKLVILDEPTSGMDPLSRRATWDIIRARRACSAVLLTTHSMEEADLLADDIIIMSKGRLVASGSPLELKARYGVGYSLTVVLGDQEAARGRRAATAGKGRVGGGGGGGGEAAVAAAAAGSEEASRAVSEGARQQQEGRERGRPAPDAAEAVFDLVKRSVRGASLVSAAGAEVVMRLPREESGAFPQMLRDLDRSMSDLGIASYGMSVTTLEEVFLLLAGQEGGRPAGEGEASLVDAPQAAAAGVAGGGRDRGDAGPQGGAGLSAPVAVPPRARGGRGKGGAAGKDEARRPLLPRTGSSDEAAGAPSHGEEGGSEARLRGWRLYWQQLRALAVKRALCASRDRLALATQLAVPLLLVWLAVWAGSVPPAPPGGGGGGGGSSLAMDRPTALFGAPALLSASQAAREGPVLGDIVAAYRAQDIEDTNTTALYGGAATGTPLNRTLEGALLSRWSLGHPRFDAIYFGSLPALEDLAARNGSFSYTLLLNQSAIAGLPAAMAQANSVVLRASLTALQRAGRPAAGAAAAGAGAGLAAAAGGGAARGAAGISGGAGSSAGGARGVRPPGGPPAEAAAAVSAAAAAATDQGGAPSGGEPGDGPPRRLLRQGDTPRTWERPQVPGPGDSTSSSSGNSTSSASSASSSSSSSMPDRECGADASQCHQGLQGAPDPGPTIRVFSQPLPLQRGEAALAVREDAAALMLVLCVTLAGSVLSASFVVHLARERDSGFKHLQLLAGAPPTAFWLANYASDILAFSLPAAGIVGLVAATGKRLPSLQGPRLAALSALLWAFGTAGLSTTYMLHPLFSDEMRALQRLNSAYFLMGYLGFLTTWILDLIVRILAPPGLPRAAASLKRALALASPHYNLARGLYDVHASYSAGELPPLPLPGPVPPSDPFAASTWRATMRHLALQALVYGAVAVASDAGLPRKARHYWRRLLQPAAAGGGARGGGRGGAVAGAKEDADVAAEREEALAGQGCGPEDCRLLLAGVRKEYPTGGPGDPPLVAVDDLWLRVRPGECFGLLGTNGAGKTTTFKVVTGELEPDAGDALVAGASVLTQRAEARRALGYCPQFDGLPGAMTGAEVLTLYARLRGVPEHRVGAAVAPLLRRLGLAPLAGRPAGAYSGGNRRRLSVGVALVGSPPLVLLDEPSTGMDPSARRGLWNVIESEVSGSAQEDAEQGGGGGGGGVSLRRTVVLTSHSMEECEALCGRVAIMSAGRLACLGPVQRLKERFGDGYSLEARLAEAADKKPEVAQAPEADGLCGAAISAGGTSARAAGARPSLTGVDRAVSSGGSGGEGAASGGATNFEARAAALLRLVQSVWPAAALVESDAASRQLLIRLPAAEEAAAGRGPAAGAADATTAPAAAVAASAGVGNGSSGGGVSGGAALAEVFDVIEGSRGDLGILDYSLCQSSLERVFLRLARGAAAGD